MKKNTYMIPLALVFCLFFLWAISSNLLPTMIRQLMKTRNCLLACLLHFPYPDSYVHEAL